MPFIICTLSSFFALLFSLRFSVLYNDISLLFVSSLFSRLSLLVAVLSSLFSLLLFLFSSPFSLPSLFSLLSSFLSLLSSLCVLLFFPSDFLWYSLFSSLLFSSLYRSPILLYLTLFVTTASPGGRSIFLNREFSNNSART